MLNDLEQDFFHTVDLDTEVLTVASCGLYTYLSDKCEGSLVVGIDLLVLLQSSLDDGFGDGLTETVFRNEHLWLQFIVLVVGE